MRGALMRAAVAAIASVMLVTACTNDGAHPEAGMNEPARYIGMATMQGDGTIVLTLRAEGPNGAVGHGLLTYPPAHAQYRYVLDHLGGLAPGEQKPVRPFPEP